MGNTRIKGWLFLAAVLCSAPPIGASADDWLGFRGAGSGRAIGKNAPTVWSDSQNVKWRVDLPGPGSSSPIVVGQPRLCHGLLRLWYEQGRTGRSEESPPSFDLR